MARNLSPVRFAPGLYKQPRRWRRFLRLEWLTFVIALIALGFGLWNRYGELFPYSTEDIPQHTQADDDNEAARIASLPIET